MAHKRTRFAALDAAVGINGGVGEEGAPGARFSALDAAISSSKAEDNVKVRLTPTLGEAALRGVGKWLKHLATASCVPSLPLSSWTLTASVAKSSSNNAGFRQGLHMGWQRVFFDGSR